MKKRWFSHEKTVIFHSSLSLPCRVSPPRMPSGSRSRENEREMMAFPQSMLVYPRMYIGVHIYIIKQNIILYYIYFNYIILYYIIYYYIILYCIILYCIILYYIVVLYIILYYIILYYTIFILYYTILYYIYIYIILYYIVYIYIRMWGHDWQLVESHVLFPVHISLYGIIIPTNLIWSYPNLLYQSLSIILSQFTRKENIWKLVHGIKLGISSFIHN